MCHIKPHFILITFTCCLVPIILTVSGFLADDHHHHALTHGELGRSLTGCPDRSLSHKGHSLASLWQRVVMLSEQLLSKTIGQEMSQRWKWECFIETLTMYVQLQIVTLCFAYDLVHVSHTNHLVTVGKIYVLDSWYLFSVATNMDPDVLLKI